MRNMKDLVVAAYLARLMDIQGDIRSRDICVVPKILINAGKLNRSIRVGNK